MSKDKRKPAPSGKAIIRAIGRAVKAADRAATKPRAPQRVTDKQDWQKG